ncbi:hypothetical protein [Eubacterium aggregans]|uniref:hypothetical protein n=1 Tax=Eubacterium aggregans TaxID=81409 RepID=UPI003F30D320
MLVDKSKLELAMARACIDKVRLAEKAGVTYPSVKRSTLRKETAPKPSARLPKPWA